MPPTTFYPTNPITPHGAYYLQTGRIPEVRYLSYDETSVFALMGGAAVMDPTTPESIRLRDLKGLVPPWKSIAQKGATQDGSTFVTSLYDPLEIDLTVDAVARDPFYLRRLLNDWVAAWDAIQPGELSFFTQEMGRWWSEVRWAKNPTDKLMNPNGRVQTFNWTAIGYDGFWRSYPDVATFGPLPSAGTASGFLTRMNVGDQTMWDEYTCVGPGTFHFAAKPGSSDMVTLGPLLANQVMMVRTDPGRRGVVDMTSVPASPQELSQFQQFLKNFLSFISFGPTPPLFTAIMSQFGIIAPQGNPYSLLKGRFAGGIPPKPAGAPAQPHHVAVKIENGGTGSAILAGGIPLRRWPV